MAKKIDDDLKIPKEAAMFLPTLDYPIQKKD